MTDRTNILAMVINLQVCFDGNRMSLDSQSYVLSRKLYSPLSWLESSALFTSRIWIFTEKGASHLVDADLIILLRQMPKYSKCVMNTETITSSELR